MPAEAPAVRTARGVTYLLSSNAVTTIVSIATFPFIARLLTFEEMGATVALALVLSLSQLLSELGFNSGITKYVAEYKGCGKDYSEVSFTGFVIRLAPASLIATIVFFTSPQLSSLLLKHGHYIQVFQLLSASIVLSCVNPALGSVLLGLRKMREISMIGILSFIMRQILAVLLLLLGLGLRGFVLAWVLGDLTSTMLTASILVSAGHIKFHSIEKVKENFRMLMNYSWPLFTGAVVGFAYGSFDQVILLSYMPLSELALYKVAYAAFGITFVLLVAIHNNLFPYFSERHGENKREAIVIGVSGASRYISLIYTPIALGLAAVAKPTLSLFAGPTYGIGASLLALISFFGALTCIGVAFSSLILVYNMTKVGLVIMLLSTGVGLAFVPFLLPPLGVLGIAIARGLSSIASFLATYIILNRKVPLKLDRGAIWKSWVGGGIMALAVFVAQSLWYSNVFLPLYVVIGAFSYLLTLKALKAINSVDLKLAEGFLGDRFAFLVKPFKFLAS